MDSSVLLAVAACLLVIYFLKWMSSRRNLPPGPTGLPIVGYLPFLSRTPYFDFQNLAKKYGNVFSIQMGSAYIVILNDFESTKEAFAKDAFIGRPPESAFGFNKETFETEAFTGLPWKEHRRFSLHMLRDLGLGKTKMEDHIWGEINEFLDHLGGNTDKPFCIHAILASSMSNNICSLIFGKRMEYDHPDRQMLTRVVETSGSAAAQAGWRLFFPTMKRILDILGIGEEAKQLSKSNAELKKFIRKEIKEHEAILNPNNVRDYIDGYLLEIQKRKDDPSFSKVVLEDMVVNFFGAGSETVRLTVEWLVLTAAHYQDAQRRVLLEIDNVIGNQSPTWEHHKSMPYTEAFIMELIRWRTIIPINLVRYALTDGEIGGYFIPKHTQIIANFWAIHHEPDYWGSDAEEFKPERFLTEDGQVKKWEHYIPFSIGKRACPGEPLARIEVFLYFVSILQRFSIKMPEGKTADFEGKLGIGLMPKPQEFIFTKRE